MVKTSIASTLESPPTGHSDRIMSLRLPLKNKEHATILSVYAPKLQAKSEEKDRFYSELRHVLRRTPGCILGPGIGTS